MFDGLFIALSGIEKGDLSSHFIEAMLEENLKWVESNPGTWDSNFDAVLSWLI